MNAVQPDTKPNQADTKPNGPVVAAFLAAGVASLVMGIGVLLNEASPTIKNAIGVDFNAFLQFDKNFGLGSGVGPLSGKVGLAVIAFVPAQAQVFSRQHRPAGKPKGASMAMRCGDTVSTIAKMSSSPNRCPTVTSRPRSTQNPVGRRGDAAKSRPRMHTCVVF